MPALVHIPGVVRCVVNGRIAGQNTVNILHIRNTARTSWLSSECTTMAGALRGIWVSRFLPQQGNSWILEDVTVTDLTSDVGSVGSAAGSNAGGKIGTTLPANVACCVTWQANRHYRGGHPRSYLCGPDVSHLQDQRHFTAAYITAVQTAARAVVTDVAAIGPGVSGAFALVAVHRYKDRAVLPTPFVDDITSATVDARTDSQRRRLGGAGS